jgi:hypothetical protein
MLINGGSIKVVFWKGEIRMAYREDDWVKRAPWPVRRGPYEEYGIDRENPRYPDQEEDVYSNLEWIDEEPYVGIGPEYYQRPDKFIYEDVNDALMMHGYLNARHIQVKVNDGIVTLEGKVISRQSKRLAEDLAFDIWGVRDVQNRLTIEEFDQTGDRTREGSAERRGEKDKRIEGSWSDSEPRRQSGRRE